MILSLLASQPIFLKAELFRATSGLILDLIQPSPHPKTRMNVTSWFLISLSLCFTINNMKVKEILSWFLFSFKFDGTYDINLLNI